MTNKKRNSCCSTDLDSDLKNITKTTDQYNKKKTSNSGFFSRISNSIKYSWNSFKNSMKIREGKINGKEVIYFFEPVTIRMKVVVNVFANVLAQILGLTRIYKIQDYIHGNFKNAVFGDTEDLKKGSKWHAYYVTIGIIAALSMYLTGTIWIGLAIGAILQGYDECLYQKLLFRDYRKTSYVVGALLGFLGCLAQTTITFLIGFGFPPLIISTTLTLLIWPPIESALKCKFEEKTLYMMSALYYITTGKEEYLNIFKSNNHNSYHEQSQVPGNSTIGKSQQDFLIEPPLDVNEWREVYEKVELACKASGGFRGLINAVKEVLVDNGRQHHA